MDPIFDNQLIKEIEELVSQDELGNALKLLKKNHPNADLVILLESQFNELMRNKMQEVISNEEYKIGSAQIRKKILSLSKSSWENESQNKKAHTHNTYRANKMIVNNGDVGTQNIQL